MMNKYRNEEGYSLLTVFLTITIFTILFISFIGYSYNTVKQNRIVEYKTETVTLAEMGVTYFHEAIQDLFIDNQDIVNREIKQMMADHPEENDHYFIVHAISSMKSKLETGLSLIEKTKYMSGDSNVSFTIENIRYLPESEKLKISFDTIGREVNEEGITKSTKLTTLLEINISPLDHLETPPDRSGISITISPPSIREIIDIPERGCYTLSCSGILIEPLDSLVGLINHLLRLNLSNLLAILDGNGIHNQNLDNKIIYSKTDLNLGINSGNLSDINNLQLHSNGNMHLDLNLNNGGQSKNFTFVSNKDLTVTGQFDVVGESEQQKSSISVGNIFQVNKNLLINQSNLYIGRLKNATVDVVMKADQQLDILNHSHLYVNGSLNVGSHLDITDSILYVDKNVSIAKQLNIMANCLVCINGNLNAQQVNIDATAKLYVNGKINDTDTGLTDEAFLRACGTRSTYELPYEWVQEINKNVDYTSY